MNVSARSVLGIGVAVLVGAFIGFGTAWFQDDDPQPPTMHQVGTYDFFIYATDPECEDGLDMLEYGAVGRAGFGISWPVEEGDRNSLHAEYEGPELVALITGGHLELVDFSELPTGFRDSVLRDSMERSTSGRSDSRK